MTAALDLHDVTVSRGGTAILDNVSWSVGDQDRWVVLGANGAGKTTLLQIASARLHPTSGTADILGERIGLASAALAERIPAREPVRDVVLTAAYGVTGRWRETYESHDTDRAHDLLRLFAVDRLADRTYGTLSEGERKRVQIARALMTDPELLLLDEPAAGLDLGGREELVAALAELAGDRRSPVLVLVTHHVEEIPPNFTHGMILRAGGVHAAGALADVVTDEHLSSGFGVPLTVSHTDRRYAARGAR
jgi:iron complex transport system ATP-binding protein